jgi:hypothetical protein
MFEFGMRLALDKLNFIVMVDNADYSFINILNFKLVLNSIIKFFILLIFIF